MLFEVFDFAWCWCSLDEWLTCRSALRVERLESQHLFLFNPYINSSIKTAEERKWYTWLEGCASLHRPERNNQFELSFVSIFIQYTTHFKAHTERLTRTFAVLEIRVFIYHNESDGKAASCFCWMYSRKYSLICVLEISYWDVACLALQGHW